MARRDQRRWAEIYVRGLLATPGRKSLASISERMLGRRAIDPLRQFVNQSTWEHEPVRANLGALAAATIRPRAWAIEEAAFPKNGANSAGVARQFAQAAGRTLNCQLALAASLVGEDGDVPVSWRLLLPRCWDDDTTRRTKAHVPEDVRYLPRLSHALDLVDDLTARWQLPAAPVLIDASAESDIEPLLTGLESRGLGYIVDVGPGTLVRGAACPQVAAAARLTAAQCVRAAAYRSERVTVSWAEGTDGTPHRSQFLTVPVPGIGPPGAPGGHGHRAAARRPRLVIAEWPAGCSRASGHWVTNLAARSIGQVVALAKRRSRTQAALAALHADFGLGDFEGRSFHGWHHHVTLVSAAAAFPVLTARATVARARVAV